MRGTKVRMESDKEAIERDSRGGRMDNNMITNTITSTITITSFSERYEARSLRACLSLLVVFVWTEGGGHDAQDLVVMKEQEKEETEKQFAQRGFWPNSRGRRMRRPAHAREATP